MKEPTLNRIKIFGKLGSNQRVIEILHGEVGKIWELSQPNWKSCYQSSRVATGKMTKRGKFRLKEVNHTLILPSTRRLNEITNMKLLNLFIELDATLFLLEE